MRGAMAGESTIGEVAKRSNAADCKSVAPAASKVRILPSPPAFARRWRAERRLGKPASCEGCRAEVAQARRRTAVVGASQRMRGQASRGTTGSKKDGTAGLPRRSSAKRSEGGSNSVVESQPSKLLVAGSIPVSRSKILRGARAPRTPPTASLASRFAGSLRSAGGLRFARPSLGATSRVLIERKGEQSRRRAGSSSG